MGKKNLAIFLGSVLATTLVWPQVVDHEPPPMDSKTRPLCIGCTSPLFDADTHKLVMEGLLSNPYNKQLRKALYWQDMSAYQMQSKAHFDNCDFDGALEFIGELLSEVDVLMNSNSMNGSDEARANTILASFFSLGQALHAIQDFYAHTNYVELQTRDVTTLREVRIVEVWTPAGAAKVRELASKDLVSGYVWWGFPQKCAKGALSHEELAKDSNSIKHKGGQKIPTINGYTYHAAASALARESSIAFLRHAFQKWPALNEATKGYVAIEFMQDHRSLDEARKQ